MPTITASDSVERLRIEKASGDGTTRPLQSPKAMEGGGAYNRHAKLQAAGAARALPIFEKAVEEVVLDSGDQPLVVADYGSSQGKNSLPPMRVAVIGLRRRVGPGRPIFVFHVDLPSNDFTSLFELVDADRESYTLDEPNVFPCAIGRSFYANVLPPSSVDLGWSSSAAQWLSRIPAYIPGHFAVIRSEGAVLEAFKRQGAKDWEAFLSLRARELRRGGRLVVVQPALNDDGRSGFEELCDQGDAVLAEMVEEGLITAEERARMVLGAYLRRKSELLAPFRRNGRFQNLRVEACELISQPDSAWAGYQHFGKPEILATRHSQFVRSTFAPSLATALGCVPGDETYRRFADQLEERLTRRLAAHPAPLETFVATMVLVKDESR
jgi:hypothetical protein